ncbi:MAG: hypothetical protein OHK93_006369 [Ramalina farinacea]|uniref:SnoaL-like domain-containing protein n=1 Tax=Ramalina farinacea TaxID=258253 RepID=A0AA43QIE0_9LECA|nr:hypothetical protein [Ramalina farinacea]
MHFTPTLTVLTAILSTASTALLPRQADTSQCSSTNSASLNSTSLNSTTSNSTTPVPLSALLTTFLPFTPTSPLPTDPHIQIRETSMLYPLLIDGKIFSSLNLLFTADVIANLSQGPIISGLPALTGALQASVANVGSHHNLGTQVIDYTGGCTATSVTYFHASLLGKGEAYGQVVYALGQYQDSWVKGTEGWRIGGRNLVLRSLAMRRLWGDRVGYGMSNFENYLCVDSGRADLARD